MKISIEPKRATLLSFTALALLFVLICGTIFWMARAVDYDALLRSHIMVQSAFQRTAITPRYDGSTVVFEPGVTPAQFSDGTDFGEDLMRAVTRFSDRTTYPDRARGVVRAGADLYVLERKAGRRIEGQRIDDAFLRALGADLYLGPLRLSRERNETAAAIALHGPDGQVLTYIVWDRPTPGSVLLRQKLLPMGILALVCASLAALAIWRARACALVLADAGQMQARTARTDTMTGLPNRLDFNEFIQDLAIRPAGALAVMFIDVNDFKRVNDTVGHAGGDALIVELGRRLGALQTERDFVARIGGDEFVVVVDNPEAEQRVRDLGLLIRERMETPFELHGHPFKVSLSQGYAIWDGPGSDVPGLVQNADLAMYHAKQHRIEAPVAYDSSIETNHREFKVVEDALRHALRRGGEFSICYQPIVDAYTGALVKVEALARWNSPIIGHVAPEKFIAVAEKSGLIIEVGQCLFELICDDLISTPRLNVSINFSPLQMQAPTFIPDVIDALYSRNISTKRVEIELTESVIVDDPELSAFRLDLLNEAGFSTSLDDFGTGYSSLGYLRHMPFQTLKIDSSFITRLEPDDPNRDLIKAITVLGHSLQQTVVAEGVETLYQAEVLRELGCDLLQGYLYDRPLPLSAITERWLDETIVEIPGPNEGKTHS